MSCLMVMAGGTGGHIIPALAVAKDLRDRGVRIVWLGNKDGLEGRLVSEAGFDFEAIKISGLRQSGLKRKLLMPVQLSLAVWQAMRAIWRHKPGALLGMGGFVSGPGGLAAKICGKPLVLHEQNTVAGMTNRWLSKLTRYIASGFPVADGISNVRWMGNPVRADIVNIPEPSKRLANRTGSLRVLVVGGSQGADIFNKNLPELLSRKSFIKLDVWHQCGRHESSTIGDRYLKYGISCQVNDFIVDMAEAYEWADVVICRAGAMTVSEVCAAGVAAVFVPYPYAVGDHQASNADYLVQKKAALMVRQVQFVEGGWLEKFAELGRQPEKILEMSIAARKLAKPNAAKDVADLCAEVMHA